MISGYPLLPEEMLYVSADILARFSDSFDVLSFLMQEKGTMEKKTPNERAQETSEKTKKTKATNQTDGPLVRKNNAPSVTDKGKEKHQQNNQKPVDKEKRR